MPAVTKYEPPSVFGLHDTNPKHLSVVPEEPVAYGNPPLTPLIPPSLTLTQADNDEQDSSGLGSGTIEIYDRESLSSTSSDSLDLQVTPANRVMELLPSELKLVHGSPTNPYNRRMSMINNMNMKIRKQSKVQKDIIAHINQFQMKLSRPTIHIYWLADDGGTVQCFLLVLYHFFLTP